MCQHVHTILQIKSVPLGRNLEFFFNGLLLQLGKISESEAETMVCFSLSDTSALGDKDLVDGEQ